MTWVDQAGSDSEISRFATLFFKKISMCSYAKAGWPGYRHLGNQAGKFSHMNTPARIPGQSQGQNILNCAWLVRSLTSPQVFWGPFGHFSSQ